MTRPLTEAELRAIKERHDDKGRKIEPKDVNENPIFKVTEGGSGLLIVDEASMVSEEMFHDILESHNGKVLFVGDHGQLPPVNGKFNLMDSPDIRLEKIHRQSQDNPILRLAQMAREGVTLDGSDYNGQGFTVNNAEACREIYENGLLDNFEETQIITATNDRRVESNKKAREKLGFQGDAKISEKIIFLKNRKDRLVSNGTIANIDSLEGNKLKISGCKKSIHVSHSAVNQVAPKFNYNEAMTYDFAYAITCHKSQGSQFPHVLISLDRDRIPLNSSRWLYTAITRAQLSVHIYVK